MNGLNDNHYRIDLSTIIYIIYKKTIFAYTKPKFELRPNLMNKPTVHVSIALLLHKNRVLVGWREAKQHQGNKHEFPGGKVEQGETAVKACRREIYEEVGLDLQDWHTFDVIRHEYDDLHVHLHVFYAYVEEDQLSAIVQPWTWYPRQQLTALNFPKANHAIIQRLHLPERVKISESLSDLENLPLNTLMYLRIGTAEVVNGESHLLGPLSNNNISSKLLDDLRGLPPVQLSHLILNRDLWEQLPVEQRQYAVLHLKQHQLMDMSAHQLTIGVRCIAACHDGASVLHAQHIGCDAVLLSPILDTPSHPDAKTLGWNELSRIASQSNLPIFALGGIQAEDLEFAQQQGAYGIAGIRHF